ncbi:hypothetical protein G9A89_002745 [Geosiphon pyriformis]|nr:hypothetical protein G9A89_002745 [Geosiphon pyriformis]
METTILHSTQIQKLQQKLLLIGACISPEEEYETCICYFCKACYRKRFGYPKRSGKWDNTLCLTCGNMLSEECNWIDVAMRGGEEIEFGKPETKKEITTTPIYLIENQPIIQLKYFENNGQGIKPKKAHKIDVEYDLRYSGKDILVLQPKHTLLPNPNIISTTENYHLLEEKLSRINMGSLEPQQQKQLKQLIAEFADIFAKNNNDFRKTDIVQHQIHTGDALPKKQQAY